MFAEKASFGERCSRLLGRARTWNTSCQSVARAFCLEAEEKCKWKERRAYLEDVFDFSASVAKEVGAVSIFARLFMLQTIDALWYKDLLDRKDLRRLLHQADLAVTRF